MRFGHPVSIADLLGLIPPDGHPWIHLGALAHAESLESGTLISCPYAEQSEEANYWHLGCLGAQIVKFDNAKFLHRVPQLSDLDFSHDSDFAFPGDGYEDDDD